ncbi:MAG: dephospho-CoA kinase [Prevotella sp.]|jgi:dephospho-CoA kinase|nr:dephospho-CoA kinase [Prevotella sp.]
MLKLGITGGIGSGKSVVSGILSLLDVPVYIADIESKKLTATSPAIRQKLIAAFGNELYTGNELNKGLFASYIFNDRQKMQTASDIIHPEVAKHYAHWIEAYQSSALTAHESAILFETGWDKTMDKVVTVYAPIDLRIRRVMEREHTSRQATLERIGNQLPDEEKMRLSDYVIHNDGNKSLIEQTINLIECLNVKI